MRRALTYVACGDVKSTDHKLSFQIKNIDGFTKEEVTSDIIWIIKSYWHVVPDIGCYRRGIYHFKATYDLDSSKPGKIVLKTLKFIITRELARSIRLSCEQFLQWNIVDYRDKLPRIMIRPIIEKIWILKRTFSFAPRELIQEIAQVLWATKPFNRDKQVWYDPKAL